MRARSAPNLLTKPNRLSQLARTHHAIPQAQLDDPVAAAGFAADVPIRDALAHQHRRPDTRLRS